MDTITHTALGACLGESIAGKKLGKKAMLLGMLANNLPDADMVSVWFTSEAHSLLTHRGITHSFLFITVAAVALSYLSKRIFRRYNVSMRKWMVLYGSGLLLHVFLDALTTYGTGWFEPFDNTRVAFNVIFILDPFFMLPMLVGMVFLFSLKNSSAKRKVVARTALSLSSLYLLSAFVVKWKVNTAIREELAVKKIAYKSYLFTPAPLNFILWQVVVNGGDRFYFAYHSLFDRYPMEYTSTAKNDELLSPFTGNRDISYLKQFTQDYYVVRQRDSALVMSDVRFGQVGFSDPPEFVFSFDIINKDGRTVVRQSEFKELNKRDLSRLYNRVMGDQSND